MYVPFGIRRLPRESELFHGSSAGQGACAFISNTSFPSTVPAERARRRRHRRAEIVFMSSAILLGDDDIAISIGIIADGSETCDND